jgi:predicted ATPase
MRIRLHNVGPIKDADVLLHPLTVLVGPNASGKTTFSTVAYAASRAATRATRRIFLSPTLVERRLRDDPEGRGLVESWEETVRDYLEAELRRCFSEELNRLGREYRAGKGAAPRITVSNEANGRTGWQLIFRIDKDRLVLERSNREFLSPSVIPTNQKTLRSSRAAVDRGIPRRALYFPASRSGFMQTYGALSALVWGALGGGFFEEATVGAIPGTTADFLQFIARLRTDRNSEIGESALSIIEERVLHGDILVEASTGRPQVRFKPHGFAQSWPIESSATSAAELAPFVMYLRHNASHGDNVFIDEPEAHFHPVNQIELAAALLEASRALGSVVIATHSEFLVGQLSNLLMRSYVAGAKPLSREYVGVYEFCPGSPRSGVMVRRHEFDPASGFEIEQFSSVAEATYEEAVRIFNEVHAIPQPDAAT